MIERPSAQDKVGIQRQRSDPMGMFFQVMQQFALSSLLSKYTESQIPSHTPFASQTRTVLSLLAVYKTPFPLTPPPPHRTTLTLAVCPPKVYSHCRVASAQTRTVASLDDEANRGLVGFLEKVSKIRRHCEMHAHMCIGSHARDVTHFV